MKREIERRFLVKLEALPVLVRSNGDAFHQGYLGFTPTVRVRRAEHGGVARGFLTIKGSGIVSRDEFEYEIPEQDAAALLKLCEATLRKVRHRVDVGGRSWEVDEFLERHSGLWLAELELASEGDVFERPAWVGDEVTSDRRYTNASLARSAGPP